MSTSVPFPPHGRYINSVRESCRAAREAAGITVSRVTIYSMRHEHWQSPLVNEVSPSLLSRCLGDLTTSPRHFTLIEPQASILSDL